MLPVSPSASHAQASARPVLRRRLSALTATAVLVVSAVACSGGGTSAGTGASPTVDPYDVAASMRADDGATATSSVSLSPQDAAARATALAMEAPEKPARMSENSPEGAVAAAEYFISLYPYVYATGDLAEWDAMSEESCVFCSSVHDNVTELPDSGGWAEPGTADVNSATVEPPADGYEYSAVTLLTTTSPNQLHDMSTSSTSKSSAGATSAPTQSSITVAIRYSEQHWSIGGVQTK